MAWPSKYRRIAPLGRGGMADVSLAMANGPGGFSKLAVVKCLRANVADDPDFVAMLVDEARLTAQLHHPNVVQILEVGLQDGEPFLAMEYLDGQVLRRFGRRAAQLRSPISRAVHYVIAVDVLAGLHHAHELVGYDGTPLSIVHRDVTPHNIFITVDGQVKVLDFGIARAAGRAALTQHGLVRGKLRYMSPEQAAGRVLDRRSDLFSVGVLLWEAATGQRFWEGLSDREIGLRLISGQYSPSPRSAVPSVPAEIDAICSKALAFAPDDRYPTAAQFGADLEAFLGEAILEARRQLGPLVKAVSKKERAQLRAFVEEAANETLIMDTRAASPIGPVSCSSLVSTADVPPAALPASAPSAARPDVRDAGFFAATKRFAHRLLAPAAFVAVVAISLGSQLFRESTPHMTSRTRVEAVTANESLVMHSDSVTRAPLLERRPAVTPVAARRVVTAPRVTRPPRSASTASPASPTSRPSNPGQLAVDTGDPWSASSKATP